MNIQERLTESEQRFEQLKQQRQEHLQQAEECATEMAKLQGEWRVLKELLDSENVQADVIQVTPDEGGDE